MEVWRVWACTIFGGRYFLLCAPALDNNKYTYFITLYKLWSRVSRVIIINFITLTFSGVFKWLCKNKKQRLLLQLSLGI